MDALAGTQRGETGLVLVFLAADLGKRPVATQAHADRFARSRIITQYARAGGFGAIDSLVLFLDQGLEGLPEARHQGNPLLLAPTDGIQFVFQPRGEVVIHILGEMTGQKLGHRPAHVGGMEATSIQDHVFTVLQGLDDAGVG